MSEIPFMETSDEEKLARLHQMRESNELLPDDYNFNNLFWLQDMDIPLTAAELGKRALILIHEEFRQIGYLEVILPNGEKITVLAENFTDRMLIIFPEDLGNA